MLTVTKGRGVTDYFTSDLNNNDRFTADSYFRLDKDFLAKYEGKKPKFGYNGLGELVFYRTYSRLKPDGTKESPLETFARVVEGCFEIQRRYCSNMHISWTFSKAQKSAQEMFVRMWLFKFLPPGRGLWAMGTEFMWKRGSAALNNCGFISTIDIDKDPAAPFAFMIDMSMLGVGIGFDTKGADKLEIVSPYGDRPAFGHKVEGGSQTINRTDIEPNYTVDDSREGWVDSVRQMILSYTSDPGIGHICYDYSKIRPAGSVINGFGGKASGPGILRELHESIRDMLEDIVSRDYSYLTSVDIVDLMNLIGKCVVAGNVRRTAEIAFGDPDDYEYCQMKNPTAHLDDLEAAAFNKGTSKIYDDGRNIATIADFNGAIPKSKLHKAIATWNALNDRRWASNNSVFGTVGMDYTNIANQIAHNGEPGFLWLDNIRNYGRMVEGRKPNIDGRVMGANPCVEQSLESNELCCLVETFPANHEDAEDYHRTLKFAYLYGKTVTLMPTHDDNTNAVLMCNKRIGLSQSGIVQAFKKFGRRAVLHDFCDDGYAVVKKWDDVYSSWLCCRTSIKMTSIKPSGTVSLLAGATAGIHYTIAPSRSYWRNVRIAADSILIDILRDAGYDVSPSVVDKGRTWIAKFGVNEPDIETVGEISIWEQVKNAVDYQRYWADNQVSCTIQFKPEEAGLISTVLDAFDDELKGISFLPLNDHGYIQAPYEAASESEVDAYNSGLKPLDFGRYLNEDAAATKFCDGETCQIELK